MRPFMWLVIIVGTPFLLWSMVTSGTFDPASAAFAVGLFVLAVGAFVVRWRKNAAAQAQHDYWLSQRK